MIIFIELKVYFFLGSSAPSYPPSNEHLCIQLLSINKTKFTFCKTSNLIMIKKMWILLRIIMWPPDKCLALEGKRSVIWTLFGIFSIVCINARHPFSYSCRPEWHGEIFWYFSMPFDMDYSGYQFKNKFVPSDSTPDFPLVCKKYFQSLKSKIIGEYRTEKNFFLNWYPEHYFQGHSIILICLSIYMLNDIVNFN